MDPFEKQPISIGTFLNLGVAILFSLLLILFLLSCSKGNTQITLNEVIFITSCLLVIILSTYQVFYRNKIGWLVQNIIAACFMGIITAMFIDDFNTPISGLKPHYYSEEARRQDLYFFISLISLYINFFIISFPRDENI